MLENFIIYFRIFKWFFFFFKSLTISFQNFDYLLDCVGSSDLYQKARDHPSGQRINSIVLDSLEPKHRKQGVKGAVFQKELQFFETVVTKTFYDLMVSVICCFIVRDCYIVLIQRPGLRQVQYTLIVGLVLGKSKSPAGVLECFLILHTKH